MEAKKKAIEILEKINNKEIKDSDWKYANEYAKKDLIRKAFIVIDEVVKELKMFDSTDGYSISRINFYLDVYNEINNL